jgi:hypothetical protein
LKPDVRRVVDGYKIHWSAPDSVIAEVSDVRRKSDDWHCWLVISTNIPAPMRLIAANYNLSAQPNRTSMARALEDRMPLDKRAGMPNWGQYLEYISREVIDCERDGEPFMEVGNLPPSEAQPWLVEGTIRLRQPTIIFGDGGAGKSTMSTLIGGAVASGLPMAGFSPCYHGNVLYLDWETDQDDVDDTIKQLVQGMGVEFTLHYRREVWPLAQTVKQVRRFIEQRDIALVIIDSIGKACGGDIEKASDTLAFFQAVRSLSISTLCVDHVTKAGANGKPIGSVYKHNEARLTFEVRKHQIPEKGRMFVAVHHQKANKADLQAPFGLEFDYTTGIKVTRGEIPTEATGLVEQLPQSERIMRVLKASNGMLSVDEITEIVNGNLTDPKRAIGKANVNARLSDLVKAGKAVRIDYKGISNAVPKYGPRSDRNDEPVVEADVS